MGFVASGLIADRVFFTVVAFQNRFDGERDAKQSTDITPASTSVNEAGVRANATIFTDSRDLFFFGFEFNFPRLDFTTINSIGARNELMSSFVDGSAYVRYQAQMDRIQADAGLFLDFGSLLTRSGGMEVLQPRVNLSYSLWDTWKAKVAYGRFTQSMITVNNEDDVISVFDAWIQIPQGLPTERADHYVLGLDGNVLPSLSTSFQTYYKDYGSLVLYNRDKIDAVDPDYIAGSGKAYGFESLIRYADNIVDLYAAYTLGWTTVTSNGSRYYPRYDRRHNLNLMSVIHVATGFEVTLRWELGSGFPFSETVGYYDRFNMPNLFRGSYLGETGKSYIILGDKDATRLPSYHRLDANATYRFTLSPIKGTVGVNVVNVYNRKNIFYFDRVTGQKTNMLPFFPTATVSIEY
jgi:hypothetical protein